MTYNVFGGTLYAAQQQRLCFLFCVCFCLYLATHLLAAKVQFNSSLILHLFPPPPPPPVLLVFVLHLLSSSYLESNDISSNIASILSLLYLLFEYLTCI